MKYTDDGFNYVLRLEKGELIVQSLTTFVLEHKIKGGFVMGIGGLTWAELGFYDLSARTYVWSRFEETLELINLTGNIAWMKKKPYLHLHATVSDASQYARGGHLNEAEVRGTIELFIHTLDKGVALERVHDKQTGLNLLDI